MLLRWCARPCQLRRAPARVSATTVVYEVGRFRVDVRGTEVLRDGHTVALSSREFQLLRFFLEHPQTTLSREDLLTRVWGYDVSTFTRTVDVHVASLRQKLEDEPARNSRDRHSERQSVGHRRES